MTAVATQLVLGLPEAGKTTFIAALRHVSEAGDVPGALRLLSLGDHDAFVNSIKRLWLDCETLERTRPGKEQDIRLRLGLGANDGPAVDLEFPDLAGELIDQQWSLRRCTESYAERARAAGGILLFVHPDKVVTTTRIADANFALQGLGGDTQTADQPPPAKPYKAEDSATQLKLVDLVQMLRVLRDDGAQIPIAVIVSAWDRVIDPSRLNGANPPTPAEWIRTSLPLLHQFLTSNPRDFLYRPYGLSAQGGDLQTDKAAMQSRVPSQRIKLVDGATISSDLTQPVQWLARQMGLLI